MSTDDSAVPRSRAPGNDQPGRPPLLVWQEQLNASPGYRAIALMDYVRRIGYVFQANVAQYNALVARVQDPGFSLPIFSVWDPSAHDDLLLEVERLLHNVLMAMSTRIDQQRAFMKRHFADDSKVSSEYAARIKIDFDGYAPGAFLRDLRNYLTHHRLPVAQSQQTYSMDSFSVTFILPRKPLEEWGKWKSDVKRWLTSQPESIDIVSLVDGYARIAGGFDKWLHDRIAAKYANEIRSYYRDAEAFNKELDRTFG